MRAMLCAPRRNMSQKLSVFLVLVGLSWGLLLLHYTVSRPRHQSSAQLRQQILDLSHRYVKALSEEGQEPSGPQGTSMAGYADLKRTIAVLLDDILARLVKLEGLVDTAVNASAINSSHTIGAAFLSPPATLQRLLKKDVALNHPPLAKSPTRTDPVATKLRTHTPHPPRSKN